MRKDFWPTTRKLRLRGPKGLSPAAYFTGLLLTAAVSTPVYAQNASLEKDALRADAFLLMGASLTVPGLAAYCNKYVEPNLELLAAAKKWNERHQDIFLRTVAALEWTGGMAASEREYFDRLAFRLTKQLIEGAEDKPMACQSIANETERGTLDLNRRSDTAPSVARLLKAKIQ